MSWTKKVFSIVSVIFGTWNPPEWIVRMVRWLKTTSLGLKVQAFQSWFNRDRRKHGRWLAFGGLCSAGLLACIYLGYDYYLSRPKPNFVHVTVDRPSEGDPETKTVSPLYIRFSETAGRLDQLDKPISKGISISPAIKGEWRWHSGAVLIFTPKNDNADHADWQVGEKYQIKFDKDFFASHLNFESLIYSFQTAPIKFHFLNKSFEVDPKDPEIKKAYFTIRFNYPVNQEDFKKRVELQFQSEDNSVLKKRAEKFPFGITFNKFGTEAYVTSENVKLRDDNHVMKITIEKGVRAARGGAASDEVADTEVIVPGKFNGFSVDVAKVVYVRNEKYEPEQVLNIETSSTAKPEDLMASLQVFLLPRDYAPPGHSKPVKEFKWQSAAEVTGQVLKESKPVKVELIPSELPTSTLHSFRIRSEPRRFLYVKLPKGLRGYGGYELKENFDEIVYTGDFPKELNFMGEGSILSVSGEKKLPLLARNLKSVSFEVSRILPDQINHVLRLMMSGSFSKPYLSDIREAVTEVFRTKQKLVTDSAHATQYFSLDLEPYLKQAGRGLFYVRAYNEEEGVSDERIILTTDLGVVAKQTVSKRMEVFVENFRSGLPVESASVEVIGRNGLSLFEFKTDARGRTAIPSLEKLKDEKEPVAIVVKKGSDVSYLPYRASDRLVSYSRFDTGGIRETSSSDQLMAMLFSDRGLYRPGEKVHIGLIVRSKNWKKAFHQVPLEWSVRNSRSHEIKKEKIEVNSSDLKSLEFSTLESFPTGVYDVGLYLLKKNKENKEVRDQQIGNLEVRIEEFVPDKLKITSALSEEKVKGWIAPKVLKANVSLKNLFGTPAENRRVTGRVTLVPVAPNVQDFKDFIFSNPNKPNAETFSNNLDDAHTDKDGHAEFTLDLAKFQGLFRLRFDAEGFDAEGGRSVSASSTALISSLPFMVGYKTELDLNYIKKDASGKIQLAVIDSDHRRIRAKVRLALVERKYVSSLLKQANGSYKYQSVKKEIPLREKDLALVHEGAEIEIPSEKVGDYSYLIKGEDGVELNRIDFSIVGDSNLTRSLEKNAELHVVLDKKDYKAGEDIEMQIRAPFHGSGLITIERDEVYAFKWFKSSTTSTIEKIRIPEGLEGNAYVNVAMVRALDSKEIFTNPLSYAVVAFSINMDQQKTKLLIKAPERVKPGEKLRIKYSADRKTDLILYGVDEGILQVAKYSLPKPLGFFFQKRALQVASYQLFDLLMPEFSVLKEVSGIGGDLLGLGSAAGSNLNPFRRNGAPPVAFWSGVLKADLVVKEYAYDIPDHFNGNLKIMAVSAAQAGLGSTEAAVLSRGDFIISPSAPLFLSPKDEAIIGVSVSNQLEGSGEKAQLKLEAKGSEQFEILGERVMTLNIPQGREQSTEIRIRANDKLGSGKLQFTVTAAGKSAHASIDLSLRPATAFMTAIQAGLSSESPLELAVQRKLFSESRQGFLAVSASPIVLGWSLLSYLDHFPYGCTEQLISKALPSVILKNRTEFGADKKIPADTYSEFLNVLRSRQTASGGFSLFSNESGPATADAPVSIYALQFLTEAKARGQQVPEELMIRALQFAESKAIRRTESLAQVRLFAAALYWQARNGLVPSRDLNFLREVLEKNFKGQYEKDSTAIYLAGTYSLVKQDDMARKLIRPLRLGDAVSPAYFYYYDSVVRDSTLIAMVAKHFPEQLSELLTDLEGLKKFIKPLTEGRHNTQSSAHFLMAIDAMMDNPVAKKALAELHVEQVGPDKQTTELKLPAGVAPKVNFSESATKVRAVGDWKVPLFYGMTEAGFDRDLPKEEIKKGIELYREYQLGGKATDKVKLGDEVEVVMHVRGLEHTEASNVAIVDLLPGGFEVVLDSHSKSKSATESESAYDSGAPGDDGDPNRGDEGGDEGSDGAMYRFLNELWPQAVAQQSSRTQDEPLVTRYVDYREDRVIIYADLPGRTKDFRYRIKAVNRGKFIVPPTFAEGMYDRSIQYRGLASEISVE